jgi:hypothetical protein
MAPTKTCTSPDRKITKVYGYHPASELTADLTVPTEVLARYLSMAVERRPRHDPQLQRDIRVNGIKFPITLRTNGSQGLITDGNHRVQIARALNIKELPVQIWPDSLKRIHSAAGYPMITGPIKEWVEANLFAHDSHDIHRTSLSGGAGAGGIPPHGYVKCECSCGARWKEDA